MSRGEWFRSFVRGKTRIAFAWIYCAFLALLARKSPDTIAVITILAGASLRFWASGYLRKDSKLSVCGPYFYTRNPLYFGTFLMAIGAAWATGNIAFMLATAVGYCTVYHFIILDEETKLAAIFGPTFQAYLDGVPRFWPRLYVRPDTRRQLEALNTSQNGLRFDFQLAKKNKGFEAYWAALGILVLLAIVSFLWRS